MEKCNEDQDIEGNGIVKGETVTAGAGAQGDVLNVEAKDNLQSIGATEGAAKFTEAAPQYLKPADTDLNSPKNTSKPDEDWSISFEQLLASLLTEPSLVDYFERIYDTTDAVAALRNRRLTARVITTPEKH